jgi:signal peptidase II
VHQGRAGAIAPLTIVDRARRRAAVWLFSVAAIAYLADRLTKIWAEQRLPGDPIEVIPGVVTFRFATNPGGAFSFGQSAPWFFAAVTVVVAVTIVVTAFRHTNRLSALALGLVLGGALGNLTDRLTRGERFDGHVVDFIDLQIWPVFNLADTAIVIGAIVLAAGSFMGDRTGDRTASGAGPAPHPSIARER